ncbi:type II secretion system major pseudopilin GspG [Rhodomicrobium sp. R_RK_3]|uniref:type II secretion system major pseudopilin GspG n=1 Tax=Rhodomicrobium TaxID=1068 RepID=UPI0032AEC3F8
MLNLSSLRQSGARTGEAGFTLIELLVVMVILVLLAGLVAPRVMGYLGSSRTKTAKVQVESISTSLELFKLDIGRYPTEREGLGALIERPGNLASWNGPYLQKNKVPDDPWGRPYHYRTPGQSGRFDIYSFGADNQQGGDGEDQDVMSWL